MNNTPEIHIGKMAKYLEAGEYEKAVIEYFIFMIRARQDLACSNDISCRSLITAIKFNTILPMLKKYEKDVSMFLNNRIYLAAAHQVRDMTYCDPSWVLKYGMSAFLSDSKEKHMIDPSLYDQARSGELANIFKELS